MDQIADIPSNPPLVKKGSRAGRILLILWLLILTAYGGVVLFFNLYPISIGSPDPDSQRFLWLATFASSGFLAIGVISFAIALFTTIIFALLSKRRRKNVIIILAVLSFTIAILMVLKLALPSFPFYIFFYGLRYSMYLSYIVVFCSFILLLIMKAGKTRIIISLMLISFYPIAILSVQLIVGQKFRHRAFEKLSERSALLVNTIKKFESDKGKPPDKLNDLIPDYLSAIPGTELIAYPDYEYEVFEEAESDTKLVWYDLGSRNGKDFEGLWKYIDGDSEHAIMVLILNKQDIVVEKDVDRLASDAAPDTLVFDANKWKNNINGRTGMLSDLWNNVPLDGKNFKEVGDLLGKPDGERVLVSSKWELRVQCPLGGINWDVFFYWPTQEYPSHAYGGSIERIGDWAYVHE